MQLADILKFGVDALFNDEDASLEEINFEEMLGQSEEGKWIPLDKEDMVSINLILKFYYVQHAGLIFELNSSNQVYVMLSPWYASSCLSRMLKMS